MPINDQHHAYQKRQAQWKRIRDFVEGADALRDHDIGLGGLATSAYLPRLSPKQSGEEYEAYVRRALYENRVARTRDGLLGLMFAKGAKIVTPAGASALATDCDLEGTPLAEMLEDIADEMVQLSWAGVLVDTPPARPVQSRLDEERAGIRPYFVLYRAEHIINWERVRLGSAVKTVRVVLEEPGLDDQGKPASKYRELVLTPSGYVQRVWAKAPKAEEYQVTEERQPLMAGEPMAEIPFYFFTPRGSKPEPTKPMLLDLVEVARSHYQSSADLEHARFSCSVPTPYFIGFSKEEAGSIALGGLNGIVATDPGAKVGFLEYTGQGTEPLERALATKAETMAKLGSRMLSEDKRDAETAEAMRIRSAGESATLADVSRSLSRTATQMLAFAGQWLGVPGVYSVELSSEFTAPGVNPAEITALLAAVQSEAIPPSVFVNRLRATGVIPPEVTDEALEAELETVRERSAVDGLGGLAR